MFEHILVPTDGSELSDRAARTALALAKRLGARVTAIHVIPPYRAPIPDMAYGYTHMMSQDEYEAATRRDAREMLAKIEAEARNAGVGFDPLVEVAPSAWETIVKAADRNRCDLIAMASHGRKGIAGLLLGSETQKVLTHAAMPVLVLR